jgi:hypothetical protein
MPASEGSRSAAPLRYAQPPDLGPSCRPVPRVGVLKTRDERVRAFDGLLLSATSDSPLFLVLRRGVADAQRSLIPDPIGMAR